MLRKMLFGLFIVASLVAGYAAAAGVARAAAVVDCDPGDPGCSN